MGRVTNTKAMLLKEVYSVEEIQIKIPITSFTEMEGTLFMYGNTKYPKYQRQSSTAKGFSILGLKLYFSDKNSMLLAQKHMYRPM